MAWEARTDDATPKFAADQVLAGYSAAAWLPTRQDPAQRATLALRIVVPAELTVAASGRALPPEPLPLGRTRHSFVLDRPAPPFLYAFAAGRFQETRLELDGLQLRALGPAGSDPGAALAATAHAYRFLYDKLHARLPAAVYSQVFVHGEAAQEAAGLALLGESFLADLAADPKEDWAFSHELAHQWFAVLVPCADFADFWLNEGLATFLVAAIKEERWGPAAYERELALWRARSAKVHQAGRDLPLALSAPGAPRRAPPTESQLQPRGVTYARGALALHRLRGELGEDGLDDERLLEPELAHEARAVDLAHAAPRDAVVQAILAERDGGGPAAGLTCETAVGARRRAGRRRPLRGRGGARDRGGHRGGHATIVGRGGARQPSEAEPVAIDRRIRCARAAAASAGMGGRRGRGGPVGALRGVFRARSAAAGGARGL